MIFKWNTICGIKNNVIMVPFQFITATITKIVVFWDVAPCSLVQIDGRFRGIYYLRDQGDE
jgi:hypothetical protein